MSVYLSPVGGAGAQFFDNNGNPLTGGKLYTYSAGTTTPAVTYTSSAGNISHSNPIVLDAAGRIPGSSEIWLIDSVAYKFVLKDSSDVLQATWDNITGINSNFVNFTAQEEVQTATAGQTVFTLTGITYTPGSNNLQVFVDGVNQIVNDSYLETNSTTVTFVAGLHLGALVKFTTAVSNSSGVQTDAALVTYTAPFPNSVSTTVENKLSQYVSVLDFGADPTGVADSTQAFRDACYSFQPVTAAIANRGIYVPPGRYKLTDTVYVHAGNVLFGAGMSTYIDASGFSPVGTDSVFKLGWWLDNGVPTQDTGVDDLPPEIYGMFTLGGPGGGGAVVDLTFPGGIVHDMWFSAPGTAVILAGGNVFDCLIDGCLVGISVGGANQRIDNVQFFNPNFGVILSGACADVSIQGCSFEYVKYEAISVNGADANGVKIVGCNFFYNVQYATISGAIRLRNNNQAVNVASCQFTNMKGPAIILEQAGTNKRLHVQSCVFNGEKSLAGYSQSTTSAGVYVQSGIAVIESCRFISLRGYALQLGSISAGNYANCSMQSCEITATDSGVVATDLGISSTQYGDSLTLNGVTGSGIKLFPANQYCYPQAVGLQNWFQVENIPGTNFVKLPVTHGASFHVKMRVNTLPSGAFQYIKNIYEIVDVSTGWNGSTQESQIDTQVIYKSPTTAPVPDIALTAAFTSLAGPTTLVPPIVGDILLSWPDTYGDADLDIQIN